MQIQIISDIHVEHGTILENVIIPSADICIVAGDTNSFDIELTLNKLGRMFKHVIAVMGNHDYYTQEFTTRVPHIKSKLNENVHLLDRESISINGYNFIGCCLWSDMNQKDLIFMRYVKNKIMDFNFIEMKGRKFTPQDAYKEYVKDSKFIKQSLDKAIDINKTVIITHFLPSQYCTHAYYKGDQLNHYFAANCDSIIKKYDIPLWIFGHSHSCMDLEMYGTGIVSNCVGYRREFVAGYIKACIVEI